MVSLIEALETYIDKKHLKPKTSKSYRRFITRCLSDWIDLPLNAITKEMCLKRHQELCDNDSAYAKSGGAGQANLVFRVLRAIFNYAIALWELDIKNPVETFSVLDVWAPIKDRTTYLKVDELPRWYKQILGLAAVDRDYNLALVLTGQRMLEIADLSWSEVDLERRLIVLPAERIKNRKEHIFPMSRQLYRLIKERLYLREGESPFVFATPDNPFKGYSPSRRIYEKLEGDCNPHSLRRTFATLARHQCQVDYDIVKRCLNHSSSQITDKYIQQDPEALRPAFQTVADFFFTTVGVQKPLIRLSLSEVRTG